MHTNWCVLIEISMEIGMLNFWLPLLVTALTKENYFSRILFCRETNIQMLTSSCRSLTLPIHGLFKSFRLWNSSKTLPVIDIPAIGNIKFGKRVLNNLDSNAIDWWIIKIPPLIMNKVSQIVSIISNLWNKVFLVMVTKVKKDKIFHISP